MVKKGGSYLFIFIIVLFSALLLLYAGRARLRHNSAPVKPEPVLVMESARTPYFLPLYLASNLGFFNKLGLDVQIITTSPEAIRAGLADGRADIALCGLQKTVLNPVDKNRRPVAIGRLARFDGSFLLARKKIDNFQWAGLKEKTIIGGPQDYSSQIILEEVLRQNKLSPYWQVTIYHNIPFSLRQGAFRAGSGDYLQLGEPDASLAEEKGYGRVAASVGAAAGDMPVTVFAANRDYAVSHRETVQKFTIGILKALSWLKEHDAAEAAGAAAPSFPNLEREILLKSIERYRALDIWPDDPSVSAESYARFVAAVKSSGELTSPVRYEEAVMPELVELAKENMLTGQNTKK